VKKKKGKKTQHAKKKKCQHEVDVLEVEGLHSKNQENLRSPEWKTRQPYGESRMTQCSNIGMNNVSKSRKNKRFSVIRGSLVGSPNKCFHRHIINLRLLNQREHTTKVPIR
jgi:hypothetical protein